jgi:hypothetical protein
VYNLKKERATVFSKKFTDLAKKIINDYISLSMKKSKTYI